MLYAAERTERDIFQYGSFCPAFSKDYRQQEKPGGYGGQVVKPS
jgi:hypothetical protein